MHTIPIGPRIIFSAALACALVFPVAGNSQGIPMSEAGFTEYVAERFRREVGDVPVLVKAPLTLSVGALQANLDRVFAFCKRNARYCDAEIETYVNAAVQVSRTDDPPIDPTSVRLVVRSSAYIASAQASLGSSASPPTVPLVDGLVVVPVSDTARTIKLLTTKHIEALGVDQGGIFSLGRANLEAALRPLMEVARPVGPGQIGYVTGDFYDTSRVVLHDRWAPLVDTQGGVLVVALPTTNVLLYISQASPAAIDALRTLTQQVATSAPNPLSDLLLQWTPTGWEVVR